MKTYKVPLSAIRKWSEIAAPGFGSERWLYIVRASDSGLWRVVEVPKEIFLSPGFDTPEAAYLWAQMQGLTDE